MEDEKKPSEAKSLSLEQEARVSKLFNASTTPRSGGGAWQKGDILTRNDDWLVECKTTVKPSLSYSVNKAVLDKADHERAEMRKSFFALAFTLGENREDYFVVNTRTMKAFIEERQAIRDLIASITSEITELDTRMSKMRQGISTPTDKDQALYTAHRAEKLAFIEQLERLL